MTERPDPAHALVAVQSSAVDPVLVVCKERHHRLVSLYPTPAGVLAEVLARGTTVAAVWLPDEAGLPVPPVCKCRRPASLERYAEPLNLATSVLLWPPVNVAKYRLYVRPELDLVLLEWVDRAAVSRPMMMPSQAGWPLTLMEVVRRGYRVSLAPQ